MPYVVVMLIAILIFGTQKGRSILSKIFKKLASTALKVVFYIALIGFAIFLGLKIISWIFENPGWAFLIFVAAVVLLVISSSISTSMKKNKLKQKVEEWKKNTPLRQFTDYEIIEMIEPFADKIAAGDTNERKITDNLPFGRITYFLNFFNHDLEDEEPLFFSPKPSLDKDELREYGTVVTSAGIYVSQQYGKPDKEGHYSVRNKYLPFSGMVYYDFSGSSITVYYPEYKDSVYLSNEHTTIPMDLIAETVNAVITSGISRAIYESNVYSLTAVLDEQEEKELSFVMGESEEDLSEEAHLEQSEAFNDDYNGTAAVEEKQREFEARQKSTEYAKGFDAAGVAASIPNMNRSFAEVGYNMNQRQGHGTAAEYANTVIDRAMGKKVDFIGGDNSKDGADRITTSLTGQQTLVQSKYYQTPHETIKAGFFDGKHNYSSDMKIEVPKDQYKECVDILAEKIKNGDLKDKGISASSDKEARELAQQYLRKGNITYQQALNVAAAGTVDSIKIDAMQGIMCSSIAGSLTALITFATCKWNGIDTKEAALISLKIGAKTIGKATIVYVVTMQLSRKNMINIFASSAIKDSTHKIQMGGKYFATAANPLFKASQNLTTKITGSALAKSGLGKAIHLNQLTPQKLIGGTVTAVLVFGPDICRALTGRISFKQLLKNSAIAGAGLAGGAAAGAAAGSVVPGVGNVVGAIVGGAVASIAAKKVLDKFVEDDAVEMFIILKEEFIDIVPMSGLTQDEFNEVVAVTIAHEKLDKLLQTMYKHSKDGSAREYAREELICKAVQDVLSRREIITEEQFSTAFSQLALETN